MFGGKVKKDGTLITSIAHIARYPKKLSHIVFIIEMVDKRFNGKTKKGQWEIEKIVKASRRTYKLEIKRILLLKD